MIPRGQAKVFLKYDNFIENNDDKLTLTLLVYVREMGINLEFHQLNNEQYMYGINQD